MEQSPASRFVDVLGRLGYKTQQQIADLLQIARPTAGTIVRLEREPSFSDVSRLKSEHDEVNIDYIFTGKGQAFERNLKPVDESPSKPTPQLADSAAALSVAQPTPEEYRQLQEENRKLREELAKQAGKMEVVEEDRQWLRSQVGGKAEASADAADDWQVPEMSVSHCNPEMLARPEYQRFRPTPPKRQERRAVGFGVAAQ